MACRSSIAVYWFAAFVEDHHPSYALKVNVLYASSHEPSSLYPGFHSLPDACLSHTGQPVPSCLLFLYTSQVDWGLQLTFGKIEKEGSLVILWYLRFPQFGYWWAKPVYFENKTWGSNQKIKKSTSRMSKWIIWQCGLVMNLVLSNP